MFERGHLAVISANERIGRPLLRTSGGALDDCGQSSRSGLLIALWLALTLTADAPVRYAVDRGALQVRVDRQRAGRLAAAAGGRRAAALLGVPRAADDLPAIGCRGGYASFGFIVEPGHELPIGVSRRRRIGIDHVGLNCAVCHSGTVRDTPASPPRVVLGMPAHQLDLQGFVQFVLDCTLDSRAHGRSRARPRSRAAAGPSLFERAAPAHRPDRPAQAADARPAEPDRADPGASACRAGAAGASTRSTPTRRSSSTGISTGCRPRS